MAFNAFADTHSSIALHDAVKGTGVPVIELHTSNANAHAAFRHRAWLSPVARAVMPGFAVRVTQTTR